MGLLDDMADAWANEDQGAETDEAWKDVKQAKRAKQVADAFTEAASEASEQMSDEEAAEFATMAVTWIDAGAKRFAGPQYAQSPDETQRLIAASAPVIQKHVPKEWLVGSIPVEWVLLGTVAMIYWPKYRDSKAAQAAARAEGKQPEEREVGGSVTARRVHAVS